MLHIEGGTWSEGTEEDIWAKEERGNRGVEQAT